MKKLACFGACNGTVVNVPPIDLLLTGKVPYIALRVIYKFTMNLDM